MKKKTRVRREQKKECQKRKEIHYCVTQYDKTERNI